MTFFSKIAVSFLAILFCGIVAKAQVSFQTKTFKLSFDASGKLVEELALASNKSYFPANETSFLLSVRRNGKIINPLRLEWNQKSSEITLDYPDNNKAVIKASQNAAYLSFELKQLTNAPTAELVLWGPFPTTIGDTIGEVVGVVRNKDYAIGIQALNIKTLGGYPSAENDIQPSYDVFEGDNKVDVRNDDLSKQLFRGDVAKPMPFGSCLQAYCRNRNKDRIIENWGHERYLSPAFPEDGGVIGSKIALFGVPAQTALSTIGTIEVKENLPHPMLDGVWGKQARYASESYLIMDFGVNNLQEALDLTHQAGLGYLYHPGPFETWGHFKLNTTEFPDNWESLKACVDKAKAQNIRLGVHTLSNFINTNDAYVTPVPDARLAKVGYSQLTENIEATTTTIPVKDISFFNQFKNNTLKAALIGKEIVRYDSVSTSAPWKLLHCQRGAFNTRPSAHAANDSIGILADHAYKVFLGNQELDQEIAKTIARLFNGTGLMQLSFDGLEGCQSEGMGEYGMGLFTKTWFDNLKPDLKGRVINDASRPGHFFWHIYTRMNWGEPWYAGFRESQTQLRLKNQQFFRRNLMPSMLGWFSLKTETSLEDIEWMLARGAGFNAGFGLSTSIETLNKHGRKDEILATIKTWESARLQGLFTEAQQQKMQDPKNEFHLELTSNGEYRLQPVYNAYFVYQQKIVQPGEPTSFSFQFNNPATVQALSFTIQLVPKKESDPDVTFEHPGISINQQDALELPIILKRNQFLVCNGQSIKLYDKQWHLLQTIVMSKPLPQLSHGENQVVFDGRYSGEGGADVKIEFRTKGLAEPLLRGSRTDAP